MQTGREQSPVIVMLLTFAKKSQWRNGIGICKTVIGKYEPWILVWVWKKDTGERRMNARVDVSVLSILMKSKK